MMLILNRSLLLAVSLVLLTLTEAKYHGKSLRLDKLFQKWKIVHERVYTSEIEEISRFSAWLLNFKAVKEHNELYRQEKVSFYMGLNDFSDLTADEFRSIYASNQKMMRPIVKRHRKKCLTKLARSMALESLPVSIDWTALGWVSSVDNQGQCGSCYTFATSAALEAQHMNVTGQLIKLSKQQILDCSTKYGNYGCNGGLFDTTWKYLMDVGGLMSDESYPYQGEAKECRFNQDEAVTRVTSFEDLPQDENLLQEAVAMVGPVSCGVDAELLQNYAGGVFDSSSCSPRNINHAILVTGYGKDKRNRPYWIVKNSWGEDWGMEGYFLLARGKNMCGIDQMCSYPVAA